jgi:hypothetical protein
MSVRSWSAYQNSRLSVFELTGAVFSIGALQYSILEARTARGFTALRVVHSGVGHATLYWFVAIPHVEKVNIYFEGMSACAIESERHA